ncbi:mitochondrial import inner membrane translocase subunit TIM10 [Cryptococcus amylolentus CBS 6039]|uniref:Mitochondrial import inner membrane translocase subunit n=2 Tax=Cryptococcus TaxID=5206 RepID=A0A1E3HMN3_9TREE|nr:mitochondrial import inner membrane translocase subunit TIM10 [Cryptococcus amylolentus CBS 6039]ODN77584.1 mitochondrial import inner membrane translocase subunit TIM10 [Cryptococcus amylolentus CBS 6039]
MSFLFGGGKSAEGSIDPAKIEMAAAELDMITDVFNRLVNSCHTKCISSNPLNHRYAEGDLLKGESVCIDRCTSKFFEVNKQVGERMSAMGNAAQASGSFSR